MQRIENTNRVVINPTISIITLNGNDLNTAIKSRDCQSKFKKKYPNMLPTRNPL